MVQTNYKLEKEVNQFHSNTNVLTLLVSYTIHIGYRH